MVIGLAVVVAVQFFGGSGGDLDPTDLEAFRTELRQRVARGRMSEAEAQVRLAEALAQAHRKARAKGKADVSPELKAQRERLKEQVQEGTLTEAEAKAQWMTAAGKANRGFQGGLPKKQPAAAEKP